MSARGDGVVDLAALDAFLAEARVAVSRREHDVGSARAVEGSLRRALRGITGRAGTPAELVRAVADEAARRQAAQARSETLIRLAEDDRRAAEESLHAARRSHRALDLHADALARRVRLMASGRDLLDADDARARRVLVERRDADLPAAPDDNPVVQKADALARLAVRLDAAEEELAETWADERDLVRLYDRDVSEEATERDARVMEAVEDLLRSRLHLDELTVELRRQSRELGDEVASAWRRLEERWRRLAALRVETRRLSALLSRSGRPSDAPRETE